jgi:hypothetical protein
VTSGIFKQRDHCHRKGNAGFGREQDFASWTMRQEEEGAKSFSVFCLVLDKGRMCVLSPTHVLYISITFPLVGFGATINVILTTTFN